ncbi:phage tail domain-containing protein [Pseudomonas sp.]|uniref:phage distal tail protein n=1 Tax=Pseudomonas sp. TaxID=306 RepID=UPI002611F01F|nr:phage tail domain-containing protein [Pseudomonas sp.]
MLILVELPGLTLSNQRTDPTAPFLRDLVNWHDAPSTERKSEQRERGYGLYSDDDPAEGGRFPIVHGRMTLGNAGDEWVMRRQVMALKNLRDFEIRVTDPSGVWRGIVNISGAIAFDLHDDGWADFEIPLEMADPRKYGERRISSTGVPTDGEGIPDPIDDPVSEGEPGNLGRVIAVNDGDAPMEPITRVSGGLSEGFEIRCLETGHVVRVTRPVLPGSVITIDHGAGEVWIDGQSILSASYVPVAEWFQIGPGETCTIQWLPLGTVEGSPTLTVEYSEASW